MSKILTVLLMVVSLNTAEIIYFTKSKTNNATVTIDKHGSLSATFDLKIPSVGKFPQSINGTIYNYIRVKNLQSIHETGKPSLPVYNCTFAVPEGAHFSYTVIEKESIELDNVTVHPALRPHEDSRASEYPTFLETRKYDIEPEFEKDNTIYSKNAYYPADIVMITEIDKFRNTNLAGVRICPFQYNPVTGKLKVYTRLKVRVAFSGGTYTPGLKNQSEALVKRATVNGIEYIRTIKRRIDDDKDDIIVITTPKFAAPVAALAQWQRQKGYDVKIESRSSWDTSAVRKTVKDFWDANAEPEYMLIVGDFEDVPADSFDNRTWTDLPYVMFDGPSDMFAEMANGRIAVSNEEEAWTVVNKILLYEINPISDEEYYKNFLVCSQFEDLNKNDTADKRFTLTAYEMKTYLEGLNGFGYKGTHLTDVYNDDENPMYWNVGTYSFGGMIPEYLRRPNCSWNHNEEDVIEEINNGKFLVLHRDHGLEYGWAWPRFRSEHVGQLENGDKRPVVFSLNCLTGRFKSDTCFAEVLLRSLGGAVGVVAACRESYSGLNDAFCHGLFDAIWPGTAMYSPENENPDTVEHDPVYTMGDVVINGYIHMKENWFIFDDAARLFHWFGDPTMEIRTEKPKDLAVIHNRQIHFEATDFDISGLNVSAGYTTLYSKTSCSVVGKSKISGTSVTINLNTGLSKDDTLILTVRSHNYRPHIKNIPVVEEVDLAYPIEPDARSFNLFLNDRKFTLTNNNVLNLKLYSVNGRELAHYEWHNITKDIQVNVPSLSTGILIMMMSNGTKNIVQEKVLISK